MGEIRELHYNDETHPNELLGVWALSTEVKGGTANFSFRDFELNFLH